MKGGFQAESGGDFGLPMGVAQGLVSKDAALDRFVLGQDAHEGVKSPASSNKARRALERFRMW